VKRLTDVGIGVLTPLAEQLANPLPHAMALATLNEIVSGSHEELPAGT
jgi:(E)-4-hydroxy-3-methylbut-2-enyl-diphosphate synthase